MVRHLARSAGFGAFALSAAMLLAPVAQAQTLANHIETRRPYALTELDGQPPPRALKFWIGENSRFAVCGRCLCVTGVMTARYPRLGIRTTSGSPTFACDREAPETGADGSLLGRFMAMTQAATEGATVIFRDEADATMRFEPAPGGMTPPE